MCMRMYKYRLYPSYKQKERIINSLKNCKIIYNELLALSIDSWKFGQVSLNKFDYNKYLTGKHPRLHSQVRQNVSDRVSKAFQNFFRRIKDKSCKQKGFPRFKSRVNSITFPQSGFKLLSDKRLKLSKVGSIPIILHRIPRGKVKTLTIKINKAGQWFAIFSCEVDIPQVKHPFVERVGIDVGLENFATLSNGEVISNPRFLIKSEERLKILNRKLSRKKKGSMNRRKARLLLARQHIKVANQRSDFLHKLSRKLVDTYSIIAVENLNIKSMVKNHWLAKSISDASWDSFIQMLDYKAVNGGGQLVRNPKTRGSSHRCSSCEEWVDMPLSKRTFKCPCGNVLHRDLNASINHLKDTVGMDYAKPNACGDSTSTTESVASGIVEAGTTFQDSHTQ